MRISDREVTPNGSPYVIAELGVNHDGSIERAIALIDAAAAARADAVKLQLFDTQLLLGREATLATYQHGAGADDAAAMLKSLQLGVDHMPPIIRHAHERGLHAIVTVFNVELVEAAATQPWDAFKTASPDIINRPLIEALKATGRPLILSTGAATLEEVRLAVDWLGDHPHVLMQCVSAYPAPEDDAALAGRAALARIDPEAIGYSDHTTAIDTGALAVASGARVLEKHLTWNRWARGPDHAASLDAAGFAEYVRLAHRAWRMLGPVEKCVLEIEREVRLISRQSLTAAHDLPAGHVLQSVDIAIKRPGTGLAPHRLESIIGRRLAAPIQADRPICENHLA